MAKTPEAVASTKNIIINGALDFWQRVVGNTTTVNTATGQATYTSDRIFFNTNGPTVKNYSVVRSTDVPTVSQSNFQSAYSNLFTVLTPIPSPAANDLMTPFRYIVEGYDYANLHGKNATLQFWFKASVTGTYSVSFRNNSTRSYVTTFTVNSGNTWEFKSINLTMDNTGSWLFDSSTGLDISIGAVTGSNSATSTLNQWQSASALSSTTNTNWFATANATVRIAQLALYVGLGTGQFGFTRAGGGSIADELLLCQRYYEKTYAVETAPGSSTALGARGEDSYSGNSFLVCATSFAVRKRVPPTVNIYSPGGTLNALWDSSDTNTRTTSGVSNIGETGWRYMALTAPTVADRYMYQYTADADF